jgi:hypothetical protein
MEAVLSRLKVPQEVKDIIIAELPNVLEQVNEASRQVYDPNTIWLESIQFADYVSQFAKHLQENHGPECIEEVAIGLINLAESFKEMGENALTVIDESEAMDGTQQ